MTMILLLMLTLCIYSNFGMDDLSDASESSNGKKINLTEYTKQNPDLDDLNYYIKIDTYQKNSYNDFGSYSLEKHYETIKNCDENNFNKTSEEKFDQSNKLKRKHKSDKKLVCEFCQRDCIRYIRGKNSGNHLCEECYRYELRFGHLLPLDERKKNVKHDHILVCEYCQQESAKFVKGKFSGKSLCRPCYKYEYQYGHLIPLDQRKTFERHKNRICACEFCEKESIRYKRSKISGKVLCTRCYEFERRNTYLVPLDERTKSRIGKHKYNIVCDFCQRDSIKYKTGKFSGKSLCERCYSYEYKYGHLIPPDERRKNVKHNDHILVCEFCQKESIQFTKGKFSGMSLCVSCYEYENRHDYLLPPDERKKNEKHKDILGCNFCKKKCNKYRTGKVCGKALCTACYKYESRHGYLVSLDARQKYRKSKNTKNNQNNRLLDAKKFQSKNEGEIKEIISMQNNL